MLGELARKRITMPRRYYNALLLTGFDSIAKHWRSGDVRKNPGIFGQALCTACIGMSNGQSRGGSWKELCPGLCDWSKKRAAANIGLQYLNAEEQDRLDFLHGRH